MLGATWLTLILSDPSCSAKRRFMPRSPLWELEQDRQIVRPRHPSVPPVFTILPPPPGLHDKSNKADRVEGAQNMPAQDFVELILHCLADGLSNRPR